MNRSFLFLADGFEEIEALTTVDVMRRAGMDIKMVSIMDSRRVMGAHGVAVEADLMLKEADFAGSEWLILPGGLPGASNLAADAALCDLLKVHKGKIAAICASPAFVLAPLGLLNGRRATGYPGTEQKLKAGGADISDEMVVALPDLVTGRGPAAAAPFALAIVANSLGAAAASDLAAGMLF